MLQKQFISFAALCTLICASFTHCASTSASASSSTSVQVGQPVNPTQALIYYGQKEFERLYALAGASLFYANLVTTLLEVEEQKPLGSELNSTELGRKLYASIPSPESTNKDYLREFIDLVVLLQVQSAAKVAPLSEAAVLDSDELFEHMTHEIQGQQTALKAVCIVRSLQRESRQFVNVDEVITSRQAAIEAFKAAIEQRASTLTLTEKNEDLEDVWNRFNAPLKTEVAELIATKRAKMRQNVSRSECVIS